MDTAEQLLSRREILSRRTFLHAVGTGLCGAAAAPLLVAENARAVEVKPPETLVKLLFDSLSDQQRQTVCFAWDHTTKSRGLLRTYISNNWRITPPAIKSNFYTAQQQQLIRDIFVGLVNPDWVERFDKQFMDDMGGFGRAQSIAIFGSPGANKFEFVLSGRHGTIRCDGNSAEHVAFGGPIVYGHAASGYFEKPNHPGNVFWHQAEAANKLFAMFDGKQRERALVAEAPDEANIAFRGTAGKFDGIPVSELSADQKEHLTGVLEKLLEPYRKADRDEAIECLKKSGGLDKCSLAFYRADDLGEDGIWDNWRLEGPSFVWHWRGAPHVHVWVNVADVADLETNAKNLSGPLRKM